MFNYVNQIESHKNNLILSSTISYIMFMDWLNDWEKLI